MAARKKAGPRCRSIGGKVYDLKGTDRSPPCARGRPSSAPKREPREPRAFTRTRKPALRPLPKRIDPGSARVGDRVSVAREGTTVQTIGQTVFDHGVIASLPGTALVYGRQSAEPSVKYGNGSLEGMTRYTQWARIYPGWVEPRDGWRKWRL